MNNANPQASSLNRESIRSIAHQLRDISNSISGSATDCFDIIYCLDVILPRLDANFSLEVCEQSEMGENHGLMIPHQNKIKIRDDIFSRAIQGQGRDRFTLAHELGHYLLHRNMGLAFRTKPNSLILYQNIEWQANCFAGELLVDSRRICSSMKISSVAKAFGVSIPAAEYQLRQLKLVGSR